jgi:hypothetical protein
MSFYIVISWINSQVFNLTQFHHLSEISSERIIPEQYLMCNHRCSELNGGLFPPNADPLLSRLPLTDGGRVVSLPKIAPAL